MQKLISEGLASHTVPESWGSCSNVRFQALTGVRAGQVLSPEINLNLGAHALRRSAGQQLADRDGEICWCLAGSETLSVFQNNLRENREIPWLASAAQAAGVRIVKSKDARR